MTKRHTGHRKRIAAPKKYHILRKAAKYLVRTIPGAHNKDASLPLAVLIRDTLQLVPTLREVRGILNSNKILIDQKVRKNTRLPVGFMDVVSIPDKKENFRIIFGIDGRIKLIKIAEENSKFKLCKVLNKTKLKKGKTQLNLHDGRTILTEDDKIKTGDTLKISLPEQKIIKHIPLEKGVMIIILDGKHIGELAVLDEFMPQPGSQRDRVILTNENGEKFETMKSYVFVVGKEKAEIKIKEE